MSSGSAARRAPSAWSATSSIARLTVRRALRDRGTLLVVVISLIPVLFTLVLGHRWQPDNGWSRVVNVALVPLFAILPPMVLAPLIAEEANDQTYSYLWSRPIPRWAVVVGKAITLGPLVAILFAASAVICWYLIFRGAESSRLAPALIAIGLGTAAAGAVCITIGVFLHKHAVAAAAGYLLVIDLSIGRIPASVANISVTHHIRELAGGGGPEPSVLTHSLWLAGLTTFLTMIVLWRIRRVELAASGS